VSSTVVRMSLGNQVLDWCEDMLCCGSGDDLGEPLTFDPEEEEFVQRAYELRGDGSRVYRRALLSRPKGWGKSEVAGALAVAELCGPVRCDGFDSRGEPVGVPVRNPEVRCLATEEFQAGIVYGTAINMLRYGRAGDEHQVDVGATRTHLPSGGVLRAVSAGAASKEGYRPSFLTADESWLMDTPELRRLFATEVQNLAKRRQAQGWMLETSTMPPPNTDSVARATFQYWDELRDRGDTELLLVDHRAAGEHWDIDDGEQLREALREAYGAGIDRMDIDHLVRLRHDPAIGENEYRRKWLNQQADVQDTWLPAEAWERCADPGAELEPGDRITIGFDGSTVKDSTALAACRVDDGLVVLLGLWQPEGGKEVDRVEVDRTMVRTIDRYQVVRGYFDPPLWRDSISRWQGQWPRARLRAWPTSAQRMVAATDRFEQAVLECELKHPADPKLTAHIHNCRVAERRTGGRLVAKASKDSPHKVDAAIAAILAWEARADHVGSGGRIHRPGKLYRF
jgi:phage terminase large subunit-like protein